MTVLFLFVCTELEFSFSNMTGFNLVLTAVADT